MNLSAWVKNPNKSDTAKLSEIVLANFEYFRIKGTAPQWQSPNSGCIKNLVLLKCHKVKKLTGLKLRCHHSGIAVEGFLHKKCV